MARLFLVRHGRPLVDPDQPASLWPLDRAHVADVEALRVSGRLPTVATWFCSPERKARETAELLYDGDVEIAEDLREHMRTWTEDLENSIARSFASPEYPAHEGWETISALRERLLRSLRQIADVTTGPLVWVGHGTAWTVLLAALENRAPSVAEWAAWSMPDVKVVDWG